MSLFNTLAKARAEAKISQLFPITHLNAPTIFETINGCIGATLSLKGIPFITETPEKLNELSRILHQALMNLDSDYICYVTIHRKKENINLTGEFHSFFASQLNNKYHARFTNSHLYQNKIYLTIILKNFIAAKKMPIWGKQLFDAGFNNKESAQNKINKLTHLIEQLKSLLIKFGPTLLGENDRLLGYSELIQFLSLIPNAGKSLQFQASNFYPPISTSIPGNFVDEELYPDGHLGQYISTKQILFGNYIQFQSSDNDVDFGAILSLKKYPQETGSLILDPLLSLDCEFIVTHSFAPLPKDAALKTINLKRNKLNNVDDCGVSQISQLSDLEDNVSTEMTMLGHHHNTLLLITNDRPALNKAVNDAITAYSYGSVGAIKETLGAEPAFWAQIPGNHHFISRSALITSNNFIDFCSFHNYQTGFYDENHLGTALTLLETPSKTPVFFNYHGKSSKSNPAKGHTAIFGGNNAGKTTFVSFMDAQMERYKGRSFFLDRDQASKIYILASNNSSYTVIDPAIAIKMNPLQLPDTPENRSFLKNWFAQLVKKPQENEIPADIAELINDCINYNFDHLNTTYRTLGNLTKYLPKNFSRWPELKKWLKNDEDRSNGEFSWIFDNNIDALEFNFTKVGFDITYLIDQVSPLISTPVYLYLVHRMRQCLDGRLTSFIIDEAFQIFNSPFWEALLRDWLPTIRKKNGHFIFMTQSPQTVINSNICPIILDNIATTILFPNPAADRNVYIGHLKLTESEYETIKNNNPESRLFLYKQDQETILCKLDLSGLEDEIRILSGNINSVAVVEKLIATVGAQPDVWVPLFIKGFGCA